MDEKKEEKIKKEAKEILRKFSRAIEKVKVKKKDLKGKAEGFREESAGAEGDEDFRKRMFENAPEKEDDCIMAEKKQW